MLGDVLAGSKVYYIIIYIVSLVFSSLRFFFLLRHPIHHAPRQVNLTASTMVLKPLSSATTRTPRLASPYTRLYAPSDTKSTGGSTRWST